MVIYMKDILRKSYIINIRWGVEHGYIPENPPSVDTVMPCPRALSKYVRDYVDSRLPAYMNFLRNHVRYHGAAVTFDLCTKKTVFIISTIHLITEDWVLLHLPLGVHNFFEGNDYRTTSGINIRRIFLDYMTKFGFTIEDLQNIFFCTDQGSNVLKTTAKSMVQDQIPMEEDPYHQEPHSPFVEIVEKPKVDTIDNECATYLREFESETVSQYYKTSLEFWKDHTTQFPTIAKMTNTSFNIPSSSPQNGTTSNVPSTSKQIKNKNDDTSPSPNQQNKKNGLRKRILTELGIGLAIKAGVIAIGLLTGEVIEDFVSDPGGGDGSIEKSNTENTSNNIKEDSDPDSCDDLSHKDPNDDYSYGGDPNGDALFYPDPQVGYPEGGYGGYIYGGDPYGNALFYPGPQGSYPDGGDPGGNVLPYPDPQGGYPESSYPYGGDPNGDALPYPDPQVGYPEGSYPDGGDPGGNVLPYPDPQGGYPEASYPYGGDPNGDAPYPDPQVGYPEGSYPYGGNPGGNGLPYPDPQGGYP
uniref:Uncharacterized protein n=1 Tax=Acrobeloides nanus TaxID=290746 RepID=A0A914EAR7_9BILA